MSNSGNILIIDDEENIIEFIKQILEKNNCIVTNSVSSIDGIKLVKENKFDITSIWFKRNCNVIVNRKTVIKTVLA